MRRLTKHNTAPVTARSQADPGLHDASPSDPKKPETPGNESPTPGMSFETAVGWRMNHKTEPVWRSSEMRAMIAGIVQVISRGIFSELRRDLEMHQRYRISKPSKKALRVESVHVSATNTNLELVSHVWLKGTIGWSVSQSALYVVQSLSLPLLMTTKKAYSSTETSSV